MLSSKRLLEMARKWHKIAAMGRKRIMAVRNNRDAGKHRSSSPVSNRGHVFVYSADGKRFMVPIKYLTNDILVEVFKMSEEEFGLPSNGPITLPCDASFVEYIISLILSPVPVDVERDLRSSIASFKRSVSSYPQLGHDQRHLILGF